jgi:hypothetical protein
MSTRWTRRTIVTIPVSGCATAAIAVLQSIAKGGEPARDCRDSGAARSQSGLEALLL